MTDTEMVVDVSLSESMSHSNMSTMSTMSDISPHRSCSSSSSSPSPSHSSPRASSPSASPDIPSIAERISHLARKGMDIRTKHVRRSTVRITRRPMKPAIRNHRRSRSTTLPMNTFNECDEDDDDDVDSTRQRTTSVDVDGDEVVEIIHRHPTWDDQRQRTFSEDSMSHSICIHRIRDISHTIDGGIDEDGEKLSFRIHDECDTTRTRSHSATSHRTHQYDQTSHTDITRSTSNYEMSSSAIRSRSNTTHTLMATSTQALPVQNQSRIRSASRSPMSSAFYSRRRSRSPLRVTFAPHVHRREYQRVQDGSASIPSQGGHVLGLSWTIADETTVSLDEMEDKISKRYPTSNKMEELKKITERQRLRLLFEQGVTLNDDTKDCERIRTSRTEHFCQCKPNDDGTCCTDPTICVCARDGVQCHVEHTRYCQCSRFGAKCNNPEGRYEYNESAIFQHSFEMLMNGGSQTPASQSRALSPRCPPKTPRKMSVEDASYAEDPPDDDFDTFALGPPLPPSTLSPNTNTTPTTSTTTTTPTPILPSTTSSTSPPLRALSTDMPTVDPIGGQNGPSSVGHTPRYHMQMHIPHIKHATTTTTTTTRQTDDTNR